MPFDAFRGYPVPPELARTVSALNAQRIAIFGAFRLPDYMLNPLRDPSAEILPPPALSPDAASGQEELYATLVDLAKAGAKEDFYFLARSSGLQDVTDLDLLWSGTRSRLRLPEVP